MPGTGRFVTAFTFADTIRKDRAAKRGEPLFFGGGVPINRASFTDTRTREELILWLNPERFTYELETMWTRHEVIGLSHEPGEYRGTRNRRIGPMKFIMSSFLRRDDGDQEATKNLSRALGFLESLYYASERKSGFDQIEPIAIFKWPGMANMRVTLDRLRVDIVQFTVGLRAEPLVAEVTIDMSEKFEVKAFAHQFRNAEPWLDHSAVGINPPLEFKIFASKPPQGGRGGQ